MRQPPANRRFLTAFAIGMIAMAGVSMWLERWELAFVSLATMILSQVPAIVANRLEIALPVPFLVATGAFIFASIFMGEAFDFYELVWWWDLALHGSSAIGFGLIGFLFVFMLFEGDRYAAPPWALGLIAFCVAVTVGALWELFEYSMDILFGTNMLKSGLDDVMGDMITNVIGALIGGFSGTAYLIGSRSVFSVRLIEQFVSLNRRFFTKSRDRTRR